MLNVKNRQKYLKKLGLYTKKVDGISGENTKKAYYYFNVIFLNKKTKTYSTATDKKLIAVYKNYKKSSYMQDDDWALFKNFKKSEFHCSCNGKYCDGYNGRKKKIPMKLIMVAQYLRTYYGVSYVITSSVRCPKRNKEVGGVSNSKHKVFKALDGRLKGIKADKVVKYIKKFPLVKYTYAINTDYFHFNI